MEKSNTITQRLPDFFILGAAKSGTSALFRYLERHPSIWIPEIKETEFYSKEPLYSKGLEWYQDLFAGVGSDQLCGEASTTYTRWPHTPDVAERIHNDTPNAKMIYIMRHPVERTYSHFVHHTRKGVTRTFEEALDHDDIYVDCSMYMKQIEQYLRFFPRENFLFLFQIDLKKTPRECLDRVTDHLGIERRDLLADGPILRNVSGSDHYVRSKTTGRLRKFKPIGWLADTLPPKWRHGAFNLVKKSPFGRKLEFEYQVPSLTANTRQKLLELFAEPNRQLEEFLGVQLPDWSM